MEHPLSEPTDSDRPGRTAAKSFRGIPDTYLTASFSRYLRHTVTGPGTDAYECELMAPIVPRVDPTAGAMPATQSFFRLPSEFTGYRIVGASAHLQMLNVFVPAADFWGLWWRLFAFEPNVTGITSQNLFARGGQVLAEGSFGGDRELGVSVDPNKILFCAAYHGKNYNASAAQYVFQGSVDFTIARVIEG